MSSKADQRDSTAGIKFHEKTSESFKKEAATFCANCFTSQHFKVKNVNFTFEMPQVPPGGLFLKNSIKL